MRRYTTTLIASGTTAATANSNPFPIGRVEKALLVLRFASAAANGSAKVQVSNAIPFPDLKAADIPSASWIDVSGSTQTVTAGGNYGWDYDGGANWVRVVYTHSSGTDTMTCTATAKGND